MFDNFDFSNWPIWAILLILLGTNQHVLTLFNKTITSLFGISIQKNKAEHEAASYRRNRAEWREDKFFDLLESTIQDYQEESRQRDKVILDLVKSIDRNTKSVSQQSDLMRLLSQNNAQMMDKLDNLATQVWKNEKSD